MRLATSAASLWRVYEVTAAAGGAPSTADMRGTGWNLEVIARSGVEAAANARRARPEAERMWLYACTCGRRPTKANPNGVLVPPEPARNLP